MNLKVAIGKNVFENPVTVASGTFGYAEKYYDQKAVSKLGALIPKTITLHAREGNPPPRIMETPAGMINAIGIENAGVDAFIKTTLPLLTKIKAPLILSVLGYSDEEFLALTKKINTLKGISALELNLSCPNLKQKSLVAQDPQATARIVSRVKQVATFPVIAKLSPNVTDITEIAMAAVDAGADGLSLVNTFQAMAIDIETRRPVLGNVTGGLSGPAIRPAALYMVYRVAQKVKVPIVAMGGIMTARDALEFIIAGATMVAVGTANFIDPKAPLAVLRGIKEYMKKQKVDDINQLRQSLAE